LIDCIYMFITQITLKVPDNVQDTNVEIVAMVTTDSLEIDPRDNNKSISVQLQHGNNTMLSGYGNKRV